MGDGDESTPANPVVAQFLTTEHFNLQTERAIANNDVNARLLLFMSSLSATIITLALSTQFSGGGDAFRGFALVLLPTVYVFGLVTVGRLGQAWDAWFAAGRGMGRIRHYFSEVAPELKPYLVMPATDEPWQVLRSGIGKVRGHWFEGLYTAPAAVSIVNSVVAGVFVGVVTTTFSDSRPLQGALGGVGFVVSVVGMFAFATRGFFRRMAEAEAAFPEEAAGDDH